MRQMDLIGSRIVKTVLAGLALIMVASGAQAGPKKNVKKNEAKPGQYVVELRSNRSVFNVQALEQRLGGKIISQVRPNTSIGTSRGDAPP